MSPAEPIDAAVVVGPTATGKTRLAVHLSRRFNGEVISADSRQVYRGLDIGTGKDLEEYTEGGLRVRHHLIDVADVTEEYNLFRFVKDASTALVDINTRGRLPVIAGGTPLYVNALLNGYRMEGGESNPDTAAQWADDTDDQLIEELQRRDPDLARRTDPGQRKRILRALEISASNRNGLVVPALRTVILAPYYPRGDVHKRIEKRLDARLDEGLITEVQRLHDRGVSWKRLEALGLEYRWVARLLTGDLTQDAMRDGLLAGIRRLCRSQDVWYRKMEREGKVIHWLPKGNPEDAEQLVRLFLSHEPLPPPTLRLADVRYGPVSTPRGEPARKQKR